VKTAGSAFAMAALTGAFKEIARRARAEAERRRRQRKRGWLSRVFGGGQWPFRSKSVAAVKSKLGCASLTCHCFSTAIVYRADEA
jgi:hypothetical protein